SRSRAERHAYNHETECHKNSHFVLPRRSPLRRPAAVLNRPRSDCKRREGTSTSTRLPRSSALRTTVLGCPCEVVQAPLLEPGVGSQTRPRPRYASIGSGLVVVVAERGLVALVVDVSRRAEPVRARLTARTATAR